MTRLVCRAWSNSHPVAADYGRTNIPRAAGGAQDDETILLRRHFAMPDIGSPTWICQESIGSWRISGKGYEIVGVRCFS
ncbi:MAG: hypothetical protein E5X80_10250 [Mesorhizobium sp.]|uniref:hypothetical protein n=1 Tax=Mesorhizobium sp. TaxID=1871066 RepID=UPI000FE9EF0F|nr:hypothetical protein [Mesorhizobium sp.]RWL95215.1 MAG: hypothetical protein EOR71_33510 [Mesorhizobium sp.]TIO50361.1 MAG: hypothetical protein E5X78_21635 [Mesorhizobium sp.]TIO56027.1 MAG: hypothetical protein E5X79_32480 [Mesorhizobium sp.]TJV65460.1 MAG: hypothetical protein E5X80_10250 [Mesorhizobium sp.]